MNHIIQHRNPGSKLGQDEPLDDDPELDEQRVEQIKIMVKLAIYILPFIFVLDFYFHTSNELPGSPWQRISYSIIMWVTAIIS